MKPLFTDTAYLVALINPRDQLREKALQVREEFGDRTLIVTQTVLVETLNYFAEFRQDIKQTAYLVVERLLVNPDVEVIEQTSIVFHDGMELYRNRIDKGYSLTDCISMNICREREMTDVLTHDDHFEQEGFNVLL